MSNQRFPQTPLSRKQRNAKRKAQALVKCSKKIQPKKAGSRSVRMNQIADTPANRKAAAELSTKKRYRFKLDPQTHRDIKKNQKTLELMIEEKPFTKLVQEVIRDVMQKDFRIPKLALQGLQQAAEGYLVHLFEDANLCAIHAKRITIQTKDMKLARRLRRDEMAFGGMW